MACVKQGKTAKTVPTVDARIPKPAAARYAKIILPAAMDNMPAARMELMDAAQMVPQRTVPIRILQAPAKFQGRKPKAQ